MRLPIARQIKPMWFFMLHGNRVFGLRRRGCIVGIDERRVISLALISSMTVTLP